MLEFENFILTFISLAFLIYLDFFLFIVKKENGKRKKYFIDSIICLCITLISFFISSQPLPRHYRETYSLFFVFDFLFGLCATIKFFIFIFLS